MAHRMSNKEDRQMKLKEAIKQDFTKMTPQQKSHLRKRLMAAGTPIPPGLESKHGSGNDIPASEPDYSPYKCVVIDAHGQQRIFEIVPDPV